MWLSSLTDEQRKALLGLAHNVVVSDGLLDPNEEVMLDEFKREMALHPATEADYLELEGMGEVFSTRRAQTVALLNLLRLSYVDGAFEIEEECLLKDLSETFGFNASDFLLLHNWVKRLVALEKEAAGLMAP